MVGKDEGGPTSQFISDFCMQLGDLCIMMKIRSDVNSSAQGKKRDCLCIGDFLTPEKGWLVSYLTHDATIIKYNPENNTADMVTHDGVLLPDIDRRDFVIKAIPVNLFEEHPTGLVVPHDDHFENYYYMISHRGYKPKDNLEQIEAKARKYYRAVGRFIIHVIVDGRNPLPSTVMPAFFQNGKITVFHLNLQITPMNMICKLSPQHYYFEFLQCFFEAVCLGLKTTQTI